MTSFMQTRALARMLTTCMWSCLVVLSNVTSSASSAPEHIELFVRATEPSGGGGSSSMLQRMANGVSPFSHFSTPLMSVHAARDAVRQLRTAHPLAEVTVNLLPGVHHVGEGPLRLGPQDGGVTWRSMGTRQQSMQPLL